MSIEDERGSIVAMSAFTAFVVDGVIDRLILEVQAAMPCYEMNWREEYRTYIPETCLTPRPMPSHYSGEGQRRKVCPSCTAKAKLAEMKVPM